MIKNLVVTIVLLKNNKYILMEKHRSQAKFQNLWQFPGGKVEPKESLKKAIIREAKEELNIIIASKDLIPICFEDYYTHKHFVIFYYLCKKWTGEIVNKENQILNWFDINHINTAETIPYNQTILPYLLDILKK